jgi:uncharacterized membrane protein
MTKINTTVKASYVISIVQIVTLLLAIATSAILNYSGKALPPDYDTSSYLFIVSLALWVPNFILLCVEGVRDFKKRNFNKVLFGLAFCALIIWLLVIIFPSLIQSVGCGCAPPGGI